MLFQRKEPIDYVVEAEALFGRFAARHALSYSRRLEYGESVWTFAPQAGLLQGITLSAYGDELCFGVGDFWSYFFSYPKKAEIFERVIDAWIEGRARIVPRIGWVLQTLVLQIWNDGTWESVYYAGTRWFRWSDPGILMNKRE